MQSTFARHLLAAEAVRLQPEQPFTWASGWHSPIYCDNRRLLAFPEIRTFVKDALCQLVRAHYAQADVVAGVATGAIAMGALVADALGLPFVYVRPKPKDHGMGNQIEGRLPEGARVVVVEDLISTGGSSLKAVDALRRAGAEVVGMVASFTYGFPVAEAAFREAGVTLHTISDYAHVLQEAVAQGYITAQQQTTLAQWRENPAEWGNDKQ
ncbi:MAG: orotate phosphoribosyltransferase [Bacteroidaceae bacterium]|nr:orotate phosphoribosyltransferase [Bacteroidaceae bacterium]